MLPIYMDCNATTPVDPRVKDLMLQYLTEDFGNAGSRTHEFGARAKSAVQRAREQVAAVVDAEPHEVIFTSGATESNNLALLGLAQFGNEAGKRHVVSSQIEHKAILEPLEQLRTRGFDVTLLKPTTGGWVEPQSVSSAIRSDTLMVSIMHVNNETGVIQPIGEVADLLSEHEVFLHVDAAQGFGKEIRTLRNKRIDLISISGHKVFGPKGVGALVIRKRGFKRPPVSPLMYGGGQERGIRPGTLPVHLIVGLGLAAELAVRECEERATKCASLKRELLAAFASLTAMPNGDQARTLPHTINLSIRGLDSEAVMLALKDLVAISNGSACTSQTYEPSHVLRAMGLPQERILGALRFSWCHATPHPDWNAVTNMIHSLQ